MEPILDMRFWTAFLSLCLFESIYAALKLTSSTTAIVLTGATEDGAAVSVPDMTSENDSTFPDPRWGLSAWVQILSGTSDGARLLQITGYTDNNPVDCYVTWPVNGPPTFTFGGTDHTVVGPVALSNRQENTWIFLYMGSLDGSGFGYATFRSNADNVFSVTWPEAVFVTRETSIKAPANANPFNVSSK